MNNNIINTNKVFRNLWIANLISLFGDVFYDVAIVWYLVEKTGSALIAGGISIATLIGKVIGSLLASQKIDSYTTKKIMIFCDLVRGIALILILLGLQFTELPITVYYFLAFMISFFTACFTPARQKSISEVVLEEELIKANAFGGISGAIVQILSWALGGLVVEKLGVFVALAVNAVSFFLSLYFVLISKWKSVTIKPSIMKNEFQFWIGLKLIWNQSILRGVFLLELFYMTFMGFYWSALPIKIEKIGNAFFYGLQGAAFGIGYFITSTFLANRISPKKIGIMYIGGIIVHWLGNFGAGLSQNIILFMIGVFVAGLGNSYWQVSKTTIFQVNISTEHMGTIFSVLEMITSVCLIPAWILGGYLSDKFSPTIVMGGIGVLQLIAVFVTILFSSINKFQLIHDNV